MQWTIFLDMKDDKHGYYSLNRDLCMQPIAESIFGDYQCEFRPGRSTIDQIFGVRQAMEKLWETDQQLLQLFIDFRQVDDSINRKSPWYAMPELGMTHK